MKIKPIKIEDVTLDKCKASRFGCKNCLYAGAECRGFERWSPSVSVTGEASCTAYAYYD
jgi:hypothetical protein